MLTGQLGAFLDHPGLARAGPQGLIPMMPHMGLPTSAAAMSVEELERQMMGSEPERKTKGDEEKKN